ncbi:MAG TPA: glycosyltransferase [Solirubrobacterales bacterium]|nr:glycosyltransferase [Solirubrobacterales bacterium]
MAIGSEEKYRGIALPGIERARDPEAPLVELHGRTSIFSAYNEILDEFAADPTIEVAVLIHEDTEIRDRFFEDKVRWALNDPLVAIVGTIGAVGVQGIDWWVHDYGVGSTVLQPIDPEVLYETPLLDGSEVSGMGSSGEVDMVDGYLLAFSRWAIKELRFDEETLGPGFHGYDADICFQARERGRKVLAVEMDVAHHRNSVGPSGYREDWLRAQVAFRRKWEERGMVGPPRLPFPPYHKSAQELEEEEEREGG